MKKTIALLLLTTVLLLCFTGCEISLFKGNQTTQTTPNEEVTELQPNPASDFEYEVRDEGGIKIKKYIGKGTQVIIPKTIDEKEVAVIGDANTALQYSLLLSSYCKKVYIYTLFDRFFGDKALIKTLLSKENIEWRPNTATTDFLGENEFKALEYKDKDGNICTHELPAVFVAIGQVPDNKAFADLVDLDKEGYIISDECCKTKTEGLFVAGDCRTKAVRQVVTAVADGGVAATNASLYIESLDVQE